MLRSHDLPFEILTLDWSAVRAKLAEGKPVIIGGVRESTVFDVGLGHIPYGWSGTDGLFHVVVATGHGSLATTLKFRDTANVGAPGPREYRTDSMQFTTATAVHPAWLGEGENNMLQITDPFAAAYFTQIAEERWHCVRTNIDVAYAILDFYRRIGGAPRLPLSGEQHDVPNVTYQVFEAGVIVYDPGHKQDNPSGFAPSYLLKLDSELAKKILH